MTKDERPKTMSNLSVFKSAGLPSVQSLSSALRVGAQSAAPSGVVIVKMDRMGFWTFGGDHTEVQEGSKWAVNPYSFIHGYIAWGDGPSVLGEKMASMTEPLPEVGAAPAGAEKGWEMQVGFHLKCISGDDEGMEARFATVALGGRRAVQELALKVAEQAEKDPSNIVPVVTLDKDFYMHKSYGRVFVPQFKIQSWVSMNGPDEAQAEVEEAAPAGEEPKRRRRVAA